MSVAEIILFPNYRALPSIVDELASKQGWPIDDVHVIHHLAFECFATGWSLGYGWGVFRDSFRAAIQQICQFESGECFFVQFEPMGLHERTVQWRVIDVSDGTIKMQGNCKYGELAGVKDPCD